MKLLDVRLERLRRWHRPGLLCIGDAAHAISPVFGIGINLAVQDEVAAVRHLVCPLRDGSVGLRDVRRVQTRRRPTTVATQGLQRLAHTQVIEPLPAGGEIDEAGVPVAPPQGGNRPEGGEGLPAASRGRASRRRRSAACSGTGGWGPGGSNSRRRGRAGRAVSRRTTYR
ncbi:FAD-dependent monooxygenase [Streptomyces sp. NBC_00536]|nr:FAD-dependent monooxygenase [Streptomyces sp. NBC_00536]WUC84036.1 FAD-dependent monooxygenase [Streptomyces sp. NBC_00536]